MRLSRDFTTDRFGELLMALNRAGYAFLTFEKFVEKSDSVKRCVVMRHDVDKRPLFSLRLAQLEHELGIKGTYYFRIVKSSFEPEVISSIASLGHEIGYHYEDLALAAGDVGRAYESFERNLAMLRDLAPIRTICMHGSPMSKHDNRDLWDHYDYRHLGLIAEPYLDVDYTDAFYITDTGRSWSRHAASRRDRVDSKYQIEVRDTTELVAAVTEGRLPDRVLITVHPQRWSDDWYSWIWEYISQSGKNVIKKTFFTDG